MVGIVDDVLKQLLSYRGKQREGANVHLKEDHIFAIIARTREILLNQPMLIEIITPVKVCGDTHGQFYDTLKLFEIGGFPPDSNYLFLGDYVDRGKQSIEVAILMFCYKIKYPENFFILRGNHETANINRVYSFYDECKRRYSVKMWKTFNDCFNCLPICGLIEDRIICMHGGISPHLSNFDQIRQTPRPLDIPDSGFLCDLLWADPDKPSGWQPNTRGVSYTFGADVLLKFIKQFDLDLVARAHQVVEDGYEFFGGRTCVTIFSAPNYCGVYDNAAGIMTVDQTLKCSFHIIRPTNAPPRE